MFPLERPRQVRVAAHDAYHVHPDLKLFRAAELDLNAVVVVRRLESDLVARVVGVRGGVVAAASRCHALPLAVRDLSHKHTRAVSGDARDLSLEHLRAVSGDAVGHTKRRHMTKLSEA